ncbi:MAG: hypothetical protein KDA74_09860, partial [Planctomycetaceae bacterium]|nr:hypothetical protein [Planctomycetaceae bacterium]
SIVDSYAENTSALGSILGQSTASSLFRADSLMDLQVSPNTRNTIRLLTITPYNHRQMPDSH